MAGAIRIQETGEVFAFDTTLDEVRTISGEVLDHPVEDNTTATNHRQERPMTLTVTVRVTESPMLDQVKTGEAVLEALESGSLVADVAYAGPERVLRVIEFINRAENKVVDWIGPRYGTVTDLMLENVTLPIERALHVDFAISFKEVTFATSEIVDLPPEVTPKAGNKTGTDTGRQAGGDPCNRRVAEIGSARSGDGGIYDDMRENLEEQRRRDCDEADVRTRTELAESLDWAIDSTESRTGVGSRDELYDRLETSGILE